MSERVSVIWILYIVYVVLRIVKRIQFSLHQEECLAMCGSAEP